MHLRTNIFLWVSLATIVPLTAIVLIATAYSERLHRSEVDRQMATSLNYVVAEFDRRLAYEREVIEGLAEAPPIEAYLPVLDAASKRQRHPDFTRLSRQLESFFAELQSVLVDVGAIRVLDARGNTLVKVRLGERTPPAFEGIDPYPYVEAELQDPFLLSELQSMLPGEVSYVLLPPSLNEFRDAAPPMLDAVVPLAHETDDGSIGYLVVNSTGVQIDRILELSPRLNRGRLIIAEQNPDMPDRDGLLLFDETHEQLFSRAKDPNRRLGDLFDGQLLKILQHQPFGAFSTLDGRYRVSYTEYLPYPNQLVSWVVTTQMSTSEIAAPFRRIRLGILVFAGVAVVLSLALAQVGARRIAEPITQLAEHLKAYAQGRRLRSNTGRATQEIEELRNAFDYMADTLEKAQHDRDHAEKMLLQSAKLASIGEMAAGIGHEINNPLNNILSLAKLIGRNLPDNEPTLQEDLRSLTEEANRASRIIRGILDFARQSPPQYRVIEAEPWLRDTLVLVAQAARDGGVQLETQVEPGLVLEGDPNQLQQVMVNLLLNAIQASEPGDTVVAQARAQEESEIDICVCDQGTAVDPDIMDKIFDPFFSTKPVGKGSGLGLSVSLGIVEHHGGKLRLQNNDRGGVTATVRLPRHRTDTLSTS